MENDIIEFIADDGGAIVSTDGTTFKLNAIRTGTVAHTRCGKPVEFTAEMLERMAPTWVGGFIKYNHQDIGEGKILASEWHDPYVIQTIGELGEKVTASIVANEHNGFSIDAAGDITNPETYKGTGISILYDNHNPACNAAAGCGITETLMADEKNIAEIVADKLMIDTLEEKLAATEAILAEKTTAAESLYTKEQMDAAKVAAIEASETTKTTITAAKDAVKGMFSQGMEETFEAEVMDLIEAEDYHGTVLKLGELDFKTIEASIPSTSTTETTDEPIVASESKTALDAALEKLNSKYIGA